MRIWIELRRDWLVSVLALMIRSSQSNSFRWISGTITEPKQCAAQPGLLDDVRLLTGASGGMVGAAYFVALRARNRNCSIEQCSTS